jgi:ParB family chromosome partitioning protein
MSRKVLGKGLSALIRDKAAPLTPSEGKGGQVRAIPVHTILPNPHQPRKDFDSAGMEDLVRSVKDRGVIQPILVRESRGGFELIAGERRWRAAQQIGIDNIPAIVREVSDQDSLELALIENLQRENLNSIEAAQAYERLATEFHLTQKEISVKVGKKRSSVANILRLLTLPGEVQGYVRQDKLSAGHAKALLSLTSRPQQVAAAREIVRKDLSVRDAERLVGRITTGRKKSRATKGARDVHLAAVEEELKKSLGTKVRLRDRKGKGKIEIEYYSQKERERLITLLRGSTLTQTSKEVL